MERDKLLAVVVIVLVCLNVFWAFRYSSLRGDLQDAKAGLEQNNLNVRTLVFARDFVDKVLRAKREVSFDDRLRLENMVRDLKDQQVLDQWNKFVQSTTVSDAQEQVKNLLSLLLRKI